TPAQQETTQAEPVETVAGPNAVTPATRTGTPQGAEPVRRERDDRNLNNAQATNNYVSIFIPNYGTFLTPHLRQTTADNLNSDGRSNQVSYRGQSPNQHFFVPIAGTGSQQQTACAVAGGNALPGSCPSFIHTSQEDD